RRPVPIVLKGESDVATRALVSVPPWRPRGYRDASPSHRPGSDGVYRPVCLLHRRGGTEQHLSARGLSDGFCEPAGREHTFPDLRTNTLHGGDEARRSA